MNRILIGHDSSLTDDGVTVDNAGVYVESVNGTVHISCEWGAGWAGYAVVYEGDSDAADLIARAIAADPVGMMSCVGYDYAGWFIPAV